MSSIEEALHKLGIESPTDRRLAAAGMSALTASSAVGLISAMDATGVLFVTLTIGALVIGKGTSDIESRAKRILNGIAVAGACTIVAALLPWPIAALMSAIFGIYAWTSGSKK